MITEKQLKARTINKGFYLLYVILPGVSNRKQKKGNKNMAKTNMVKTN